MFATGNGTELNAHMSGAVSPGIVRSRSQLTEKAAGDGGVNGGTAP